MYPFTSLLSREIYFPSVVLSSILFALMSLLVASVSHITSPGALSSFAPGGQYIMLTFDGGPHATITPKILDILRARNATATFFVSGLKSVDHGHIIQRIANEGHEVALQGWNDNPFTKIKQSKLVRELTYAHQIVSNITNKVHGRKLPFATKIYPAVVRPPGGATNMRINDQIRNTTGLKVVLWNLDSKDISEKDPKTVAKTVIAGAHPGDVVLLHDGLKVTLEAFPEMLDGLIKDGYETLTISEVISFPDDTPR
jgi:peptidoglycan-N-acetylglucosamine deacetylase